MSLLERVFWVAVGVFVSIFTIAVFGGGEDSGLSARVQESCRAGHYVADWRPAGEDLISVTCVRSNGYGNYVTLVER